MPYKLANLSQAQRDAIKTSLGLASSYLCDWSPNRGNNFKYAIAAALLEAEAHGLERYKRGIDRTEIVERLRREAHELRGGNADAEGH